MLSWNLTTKPFKKSPIRPSNIKQVARGLQLGIEETMLDVMFEVPSQENVKLVRIKKLSMERINQS